MKDYYKILEVNKDSSQEEIKKSYRKLAMLYHPDKNQTSGAEEKFKDIAEAYEVLSDPNKKANYDQYGDVNGNPFSNSGGFSFNMDDMFGDLFNSRYGGNRHGRKQKKGTDLRIKITITLDDVIHGLKKKVKYKRKKICTPCNGDGGTDVVSCNSCNGSGKMVMVQNTPFGQIRQETMCNSCLGSGKTIKNKCKHCHGEGLVSKDEEVEIQIPAGLRNNIQLNMSNYGNEIKDGISGDLLISISEIPDPYFKREGSNLYYDYHLNVIDALTGKKDVLKTPKGEVKIDIRSGINPNEKLSFKNMGVPDIEMGLGDLILNIKFKMPSKISETEMQQLENLKKSENFKS